MSEVPLDLEISVGEAIATGDVVSLRTDVIQAVHAVARDRERLQRAADLAGILPSEEAARRIAQDTPEVTSLLSRAPAAVKGVVIWVLLTAIQIIAAEVLAEYRDHSATAGDVERIVAHRDREIQHEVQVAVDRALEKYYRQHPPPPESKPRAR